MDCFVFVVDDDAATCDLLDQLLEDEGYQVVCVQHARDALDYLMTTTRLPDVVLIDFVMPGMNAVEFRRRQQQDPQLAAIPVVLMSARRSLDVSNIDPPAAAVVDKPFSIDSLVAVIEQVCGENRVA